MQRPIIRKSDDTLGRIAVFTGTRVPVKTLVDYLAAGDAIEASLEDFTTVSREQILAFLDDAIGGY